MSKVPGSAHPAFGLGGLVMAGGAAGYMRAGSKASLGSGLLFGGLLVGSGVMISGDNQLEGHCLAAGTSSVLALAMGRRFVVTRKVMPSGVVAVLGAASAGYHTLKAIEWMD